MTPRRLAVILGCAGALVLLALGYAALKYRGKPAPAPEIVQSPVVQAPEPSPPVSELPKTPTPEPKTPKPPADAEIKPAAARKESEAEQKAPLDPVRVAAAWEKVEHIRNNLHLYGDFHPEADEIIDQLLPVPTEGLDEGEGEEVFSTLR